MPENFLACDRDQPMLLPPDLRDWLDDDHLAWFVIEAIEELDLEPFYGAYRADGHGRAAHEPKMMVTLFAYAYAVGERSSRGIERRCREDVAFRVICANQVPDHATIARFRVRHEAALAGLFGQVLGLCAKGAAMSCPSGPSGFAPRTAAAPGFAKPRGARARAGREPRAGARRALRAPRDLPAAARRELGRRAPSKPALRGLPRPRGDARRASIRFPPEALLAARDTRGQDQHHRPGC